MPLAAVVQLNSTSDGDANVEAARRLIERAADRGAELVATPENSNYLGPHEEKVRRAESLDGPTCGIFARLAEKLSIEILLGSFAERSDDPARCYNTSVLFAADGSTRAVYRKIHLFDVDLSPEVRFSESSTVVGGDELVTAETCCGRLGLSICYDLRFPELYRQLTARGAELLAVPSAFTARTGKDHWEPLLRARAIENQCYVLAPAQHGRHDDDGLRESHGHAMIVDPWGAVVAQAADGIGMAVADVDLERLRSVRRSMPVADHRRL